MGTGGRRKDNTLFLSVESKAIIPEFVNQVRAHHTQRYK